jgi:molybdate transport system substrate-binding protein
MTATGAILRPVRCAPLPAVILILFCCYGFTAVRDARGDEALAAVAANFVDAARELAAVFARDGKHRVRISTGSTGALYAQITHGAPFDIFLAARAHEPALLAQAGLAVPNSRFTYAVGSLVVWSADAVRIHGDCEALLKRGDYKRVAMANPALAPYGAAARASLQSWGLWDTLAAKLLRAESVGQAFQFVATGNADLGFVALSQVVMLPRERVGSYCVVNAARYPPLRQQAVLLHHGEGNEAAQRFLEFLRGEQGLAIIRSFCYRAGAAD